MVNETGKLTKYNQNNDKALNTKLVEFLNKEHTSNDLIDYKHCEWIVTKIFSVRQSEKKLEYDVAFKSYNGLQFTRAWILEEDIYAPDLLDNFLKLREGRQTRATSKIMQDENKDYLNMATNLPQVPENLYTNDFFRHLDFFFLFS